MRITISGTPGSGKSTVARTLAKRLGYRYVNTGQIFRDAALARGMTIQEFARYVDTHPAVDRKLDAALLREARAHEHIILEGRLTGWLTKRARVPALRLWVTARETIRVDRLMQRDGGTRAETLRRLRERAAGERARYQKTYGIDLRDLRPYDVVIETDELNSRQTAARILAELRIAEGARSTRPATRRRHV
jgi:cytidylate kinase